MISTFWFLIKAGLFITAFMWIVGLGGNVHIGFSGYDLNTSFGIFTLLSLFTLWIVSFVYRVIKAIFSAPKTLATYSDKRAHVKGLQALAYGLSAVAAGDAKNAHYYAKRTARFLNNDFGLAELLSGLSARLNQDNKVAVKSFSALSDHPETAFLGLKGLLQIAIEKGDYRYARVLAEKAYTQSPKQPWITQAFYDIALHTKDYQRALSLLPVLKKSNAIDCEKLKKDEAILYMTNGDIKKALKLSSTSIPVAISALNQWADEGKRRKSIGLIKKIWSDNPHPDILNYWIKYAPKKTINNTHAMVSWIEELHRYNPDSSSGALYIATAVQRLNQPEHATRFLRPVLKSKPTVRAYQLMHRIDPLGGWLEQIPNASQDKAWVCSKTGRIYTTWKDTNQDGDFNTIEWMYPNDVRQNNTALNSALSGGLSLFESKVA